MGRNIMIAVSGLSSAVITEALYALATDEGNEKYVAEVHIITTGIGWEKMTGTKTFQGMSDDERFFFKSTNRVAQLCVDYGISPPTLCSQQTLHVLTDEQGDVIQDILTPEDNNSLLDKCIELANKFSSDPDTSIFYLVAGGRKTMTSNLTLAAQLYGRRQDQIYHVLLKPLELEEGSGFWYPPIGDAPIKYKNKDRRPSKCERDKFGINLINVKFIRIRSHVKKYVLNNPKKFTDFVPELIGNNPRLEISLPDKAITCIGDSGEYGFSDMAAADFAVYAYIVYMKIRCTMRNEIQCKDCNHKPCFIEPNQLSNYTEDMSKIYRRLNSYQKGFEMLNDLALKAKDKKNIEIKKGDINKTRINIGNPAKSKDGLISYFGDDIGKLICINDGYGKWGINLDPSRITIDWGPEGPI